MAVRRACPLCKSPFPMHTGMCLGLRAAIAQIPSLQDEEEPPVLDVRNARMKFVEPTKVIVLEGVDDE